MLRLKGPHTVDQNRSNGPAYGVGALRSSRCRSKYTSAALNNIIHDEYRAMTSISLGIMITSWSMLCDRKSSMSAVVCWEGTSRSPSAFTSSTGECHWSMVAMGEDSTARRFASSPSIGSPTEDRNVDQLYMPA